MAVYGYTRVSTIEQAGDSKSSLAEQERKITGAAMVRGEEITTMFSDPGISGSVPLFSRPAGQQLLAVLKDGDIVIASKMDRIFRSISDATATVESLQKRNISMILVDIGTDPVTGGVSKLFFSIFAAVAEFERYRITERNLEGRNHKRSRGGFIGGEAPYGYSIRGKGSSAVLVEDADEQKTVALVHGLAEGRSARDIARELNRLGHRNRLGRPFHQETVGRIMRRVTNG